MTKPRHVVEIFLQPGEIWFGDEHTRIRTLLGSCVAITLWHPGRKIGGMCHFMLPNRGACRGKPSLNGRYGDEALQMLLNEIRSQHGDPTAFEAKLFGGGYMFSGPHASVDDAPAEVQKRNIDAGRALLAQHGIRLKAHHLGGDGHRQVIFDVWSGYVWMRQVPPDTAYDSDESDGHVPSQSGRS